MQEPESKHTGAVYSAAVHPDGYFMPQAIALLLVRTMCSSAMQLQQELFMQGQLVCVIRTLQLVLPCCLCLLLISLCW